MVVAAAAAVMVVAVIKEEDAAGAEVINKTLGNKTTRSIRIRTRIIPSSKISRTQILFSNSNKNQILTSVGLGPITNIAGRMELAAILPTFAECRKRITAGMRRLKTR